MGKTKAKKIRSFRNCPTGLPSLAEASRQSSACEDFGRRMLPLVEKLSSPTPEERECACASLANLVFDQGAVPVLLKQDVVRRLGPLLMDPQQSIREAAAGTLRNLSLGGGPEVCVKMVDQDVMTPLITFIHQSLDALKSVEQDPESEIWKQVSSQAIQGISLLWNLCESSAVAVDVFNREGLLSSLVSCLQTELYPSTVAIPAAQCLHTVTEDNSVASQAICGSSDLMKTIEKSLMAEASKSNALLLKVLTAGILYNVRYSIPVCSLSELLQAVVRVLAQVLEVNCHELIEKLLPELSKVEEVLMLLNAQQLALEILSNMCCPDGEDEWEDVDEVASDGHSDDGGDEEPLQDMDMIPDSLSGEVVSAFVTQEIAQKVLAKTAFGDLKIYESLDLHEDGKKVFKSLNMVQTRALTCLNNIVSALDTELLGAAAGLGQLWNTLFALTFSTQAPGPTAGSDELLEAATGVLRSTMEKLAALDEPQYITAEQVALLCQTTAATNCEAIKVNLISILGFVGKMAAKKEDTLDILKALGMVLRDIAAGQHSLWLVGEALDAIFDTFADGPLVNVAAASIGLMENLQNLASVLKTRVKAERRTLGEHRAVVDAARINLARFIKYKLKGH